MKTIHIFLTCLILGISFAFTSCGDKDEPANPEKFSNITLIVGNSHTITLSQGIVWSSSNPLVANIEGNVVTAKHVGEATVSSSKGSFTVKVNPKTKYFTEPCILWGKSKSDVKSTMSAYTLIKDDTETLGFADRTTNATILWAYSFKNGLLNTSAVFLNGKYWNSDNIMNHLLERYVPTSMNESNYSFYFLSPKKDLIVLLKLDASGSSIIYEIYYTKYDGTSTSRSYNNEVSFSELRQQSNSANILETEFRKIENLLTK